MTPLEITTSKLASSNGSVSMCASTRSTFDEAPRGRAGASPWQPARRSCRPRPRARHRRPGPRRRRRPSRSPSRGRAPIRPGSSRRGRGGSRRLRTSPRPRPGSRPAARRVAEVLGEVTTDLEVQRAASSRATWRYMALTSASRWSLSISERASSVCVHAAIERRGGKRSANVRQPRGTSAARRGPSTRRCAPPRRAAGRASGACR